MAEELKNGIPEKGEPAPSQNFIHEFIAEDIAPGGQLCRDAGPYPFSPRAQRLSPHRPLQGPDHRLRLGREVRRHLQPAHGRHQPRQGGRRSLWTPSRRTSTGWASTGGTGSSTARTTLKKTYELAVGLIKKGLAYVCELTPEQFKEYRGDVNTPARSPWRDRPIEESLDLFERMKNGEFPEGKYTLRAKIDLESGNFNMRDPVLYRIRYIEHHRQGTKWCIFPMYDFAHPIQDALEGITHSLCSLEYEDHRPLYDWVIEQHRRAQQAPADRVCPPGHQLHGHVQAEAAQAGGGGLCVRLGRPPDAHPVRPAPPGLHPRLHPQLLRPHRRGQEHLHWWSTASWSTACGRT